MKVAHRCRLTAVGDRQPARVAGGRPHLVVPFGTARPPTCILWKRPQHNQTLCRRGLASPQPRASTDAIGFGVILSARPVRYCAGSGPPRPEYATRVSAEHEALAPRCTSSHCWRCGAVEYELDSQGRAVAAYGNLDAPADSAAILLRVLLQIGSVAVTPESLFVMRYSVPTLEVYPRGGGRTPSRSVRLARWRPWLEPTEVVGQVDASGFIQGTRARFDEATRGFARDAAGRLYLVMLGPPDPRGARRAGSPLPREELWIFDADGGLLSRASLPTRNTRALGIAGDGSLLLLAHPTSDPADSWDVLRRPPMDSLAGSGRPCDWRSPSKSDSSRQ